MDDACYDGTDTVIMAVFGGKIYKCNATTGAVITSAAFAQPGFSPACCAWDSGLNRVFAAAWNAPRFSNVSPSNVASPRNVYRINPNGGGSTPPSVDLTIDIYATFGITDPNLAYTQVGISSMRGVSPYIYARYFSNSGGAVQPAMGMLRFLAATPATHAKVEDTEAGYASCAYGAVGGDDVLFATDQQNQTFNQYDFTSATLTAGTPDDTKVVMAIEFVPGTGTHLTAHLFVTDQSQFVYVYTVGGALVATIDTGVSAFNGLGIRYNSTSDLVFVAGGGSNDVAVINPTSLALSGIVRTGFDMPVNICPAAARTFAVQQGGTGLKEIV